MGTGTELGTKHRHLNESCPREEIKKTLLGNALKQSLSGMELPQEKMTVTGG